MRIVFSTGSDFHSASSSRIAQIIEPEKNDESFRYIYKWPRQTPKFCVHCDDEEKYS